MKKYIFILLAISMICLMIPILTSAESIGNDDIYVTLDKTELQAGDTITATYKVVAEGTKILKLEWQNWQVNGGGSGLLNDNVTDQEGTFAFKPRSNGTCEFTLSYEKSDGTLKTIKKSQIPVHGITVEYTKDAEYDEEKGYYILESGNPYICEFTISGGVGKYTIESYCRIATEDGTYDVNKQTQTISGTNCSLSYQPPEGIVSLCYFITINDENGGEYFSQRPEVTILKADDGGTTDEQDSAGEENKDIIVTLDKTELQAGDTITATYKVVAEGTKILKLEWQNWQVNGGGSGLLNDNVTDQEGTFAFKPRSNGTCEFTLSYEKSDGTLKTIKKSQIPVHGITVEYTKDAEYDEEKGYYILESGNPYICEFTISGGVGKYTIESYCRIATEDGTYDVNKQTQTISGTNCSLSYQPPEGIVSLCYFITINDENGGEYFSQRPEVTILKADDGGTTDGQKSADDAGTTDGQKSANDAGTTDGQKSADEAGTTDGQKSVDDAGTTDGQKSADEAGITDEQGSAAVVNEPEGTKSNESISTIQLGKSGWVHNNDGTWSYGDSDGNAVIGSKAIDGVMYRFTKKGIMISGWVNEDGKWYCAKDSGALYHNGWAQLGGIWYYFKSDGEMATGWVNDGKAWYYMKSDGTMATGWVEDQGKWYYLKADGSRCTGWLKEKDIWYYLQTDGAMAVGWVSDGGSTYYMRSSGAMATGWVQDHGAWYYFKPSGAMMTGWLKDGESWYYLQSNGAMATGWQKDGSTWYYMSTSGAMVTGWLKINGAWYYFESSGAMKTGWLKDSDGTWYWFDSEGAMVVGLQTIDSKQEMFSSGGAWMYTVK